MANDLRLFLAQQVIARRKRADLSQAALSRLTNLSIARISEIERAIANPTLDTLESLAKVLQVSVIDLLDYESELRTKEELKANIEQDLEQFTARQLQTLLAIVKVMRK